LTYANARPGPFRIEVRQQDIASGLARVVRPDQRVYRPALDPEIHAVHRDEALELLGEPAGLEDVFAGAHKKSVTSDE